MGYIAVKAKTVAEAKNAIKAQVEATSLDNTAGVDVSNTSGLGIAKYYPENEGAVKGTLESKYLYEGDTFDRIGSVGENSNYVSPIGTPESLRFLPSNNDGAYSSYKVLKPFPVQSSQIAPFGGTQYQTIIILKTKQLRKKLEDLNIPKSIYNLEGSVISIGTVLYKNYDKWEIIHIGDKGEQKIVKIFNTEEEACQFNLDEFIEYKNIFRINCKPINSKKIQNSDDLPDVINL
jgi:hypothetical protein